MATPVIREHFQPSVVEEERVFEVLTRDTWLTTQQIARAARMCTARAFYTVRQLAAAGEVERTEVRRGRVGRAKGLYRLAMRSRQEPIA